MERRRFTREFKLEAVRLIRDRGVSYAQASQDLSVHPTQLRSWVKALAADPQQAFPGQGQMKPEQAEIARLKREVAGTPVLRRPFSDAELSALQGRVWSLSCGVAPPQETHRDALLRAILGMLGGFPMMQRYDEVAGLAIAAAYLWSARKRPRWAILKACDMVRSGNAGLNLAFCPSEAEFNTIAGRCADPYVNALRRAKELLAAVDGRAKQLLAGRTEAPREAPRPMPAKSGQRELRDGRHVARALADLERGEHCGTIRLLAADMGKPATNLAPLVDPLGELFAESDAVHAGLAQLEHGAPLWGGPAERRELVARLRAFEMPFRRSCEACRLVIARIVRFAPGAAGPALRNGRRLFGDAPRPPDRRDRPPRDHDGGKDQREAAGLPGRSRSGRGAGVGNLPIANAGYFARR
jgi:transposase